MQGNSAQQGAAPTPAGQAAFGAPQVRQSPYHWQSLCPGTQRLRLKAQNLTKVDNIARSAPSWNRCTGSVHRINVACCAQAAPAAGNSNLQQGLRTTLEQIIAANQLQHFYPPQALQAVLNRLNTVDFRCSA